MNDYMKQRLEFKNMDELSLNSRGMKVINTLPVKLKKKKKLLPLNKLRDKAQAEFNKFIRRRDMANGCIDGCGGNVDHAGHYYNAGQYTALRFNEDNCHGQALSCNYHKHGNLINYRTGLIKKIGEQRLSLLESIATRQRVKKWSRMELEVIYMKYKLINGNT